MEMSYGENWIIEKQYIFYIVFNITYFFSNTVYTIYIMSKKVRK